MLIGDIFMFIITTVGIFLIPIGFQTYKTTDLTAGGILIMFYGILALVITIAGTVKLLS